MKSNAIVLVKDGQAVGIGAGQQNRVESGEIAAKKADGPRRGRRVRVATRSTRSPTASRPPPPRASRWWCSPAARCATTQVIERADELGLAMVFTGERHFLH